MIRLKHNEEKDILKVEPLHKKQASNLCIFSHFDTYQKIDAYVVAMIEEIYKFGFDIVFVTTSEHITSAELTKIKQYLYLSIVKKNHGYDFMSWKTALALVSDYKNYEKILHVNDSIFFPLTDPKKMFDIMEKRHVDCWGLTDSYKQTYHLESFFWVVNKKLLQSKAYEEFWNQCKILDDKSEIIREYEMGFAPFFMKHGFSCSAYIEQKKVLEKLNSFYPNSRVENLEHKRSFYLFWDIIIKDFGAPFIKKRTLLENPTTFDYKEILNQYTAYDTNLIAKFLERESKINALSSEQKSEEFFANLSTFTKALESLKNKNELVLYGFGEIGFLIYSNLAQRVHKIVDRSYSSLVKRYPYIDKFCSAKDISIEAVVVITAFGREAAIKKDLLNQGFASGNIVSIGDLLEFDALKFANNITKLLYHCDALYRLSVQKSYKISLYSSCEDLNMLLKNYLQINNMSSIDLFVSEDSNRIYFLLLDSNKKVHQVDFMFV